MLLNRYSVFFLRMLRLFGGGEYEQSGYGYGLAKYPGYRILGGQPVSAVVDRGPIP
jgi:hypothetical protein